MYKLPKVQDNKNPLIASGLGHYYLDEMSQNFVLSTVSLNKTSHAVAQTVQQIYSLRDQVWSYQLFHPETAVWFMFMVWCLLYVIVQVITFEWKCIPFNGTCAREKWRWEKWEWCSFKIFQRVALKAMALLAGKLYCISMACYWFWYPHVFEAWEHRNKSMRLIPLLTGKCCR